MKHRAFTLIEMIVVVAIMLILAAILFPVLSSHPHSHGGSASCRSNLKQIGLGFLMYAQDYNEKFPAVAASGGWGNAVQPYIKTWYVFHCPSSQSKGAEQTTDYFLNARLSGVKQTKIEALELSILIADGRGGQPLNYSLSQLPDAWRKDEKSPAWRHLDMANYLFADGHVKPLKPKQVTLDKPGKNNPTFLLGWNR